MSARPVRDRRLTPDGEEMYFRTTAAPGLDEDDLFAALAGLPGSGALWGEATGLRPAGPPDPAWCEERERRARHEQLLRKWPPEG